MDTITFDALNLEIKQELVEVNWQSSLIEVKQYLPVNDKLELISWVINQSADDLKFYNVGKLDIFKTLGIIRWYTNIEIPDDVENPTELYDAIVSSTLLSVIQQNIPLSETEWIDITLKDTVDSIYKYQNSLMGILDTVTADYSNLNFDVEQLQKNISNPENLTLLKDVMTKLG